MKKYYVDLQTLPLSERADAISRMDGVAFLATEVYEAGVLVGANVFWNSDTEPLPSDIPPSGCTYRPV